VTLLMKCLHHSDRHQMMKSAHVHKMAANIYSSAVTVMIVYTSVKFTGCSYPILGSQHLLACRIFPGPWQTQTACEAFFMFEALSVTTINGLLNVELVCDIFKV